MMDHADRKRQRRRWSKPGYTRLCLLGALLAGGALMLFWRLCYLGEQASLGGNGLMPAEPLLVSYSYSEKDQMAIEDLRYFMAVGMGISQYHKAPVNTDVVLLVSGDTCTPCNDILQDLKANPSVLANLPATAAWRGPGIDLLQRPQTTDTDFAVHNITLELVRQTGRYSHYSAFMFLNSGVRGPYVPSWVPPGWQWTMAFTNKLKSNVGAVSSSMTCLPPSGEIALNGTLLLAVRQVTAPRPVMSNHTGLVSPTVACLPPSDLGQYGDLGSASEVGSSEAHALPADLGEYGPKMETWAVALRADAMDLVLGANIFELPPASSIVIPAYAMSRLLLQSGLTFTSLLSKYRGDVDWRGQQHWHCNNNIHPSRHGTYSSGGGQFGISIHPYETIFVPSSWFVGEPHMTFYSQWAMEHAVGSSGTDGLVDERWYRYAISPKAVEPNNAQECFRARLP